MTPADTQSQSSCHDVDTPADGTILVKCGSATGVLYLDKLIASGGQKCILSDFVWYTPSEFKGLGSKGRSKIGGNPFIM